MVNPHSELLWHELKWQGEDAWCVSCVFTGSQLKLPATIFSQAEKPQENYPVCITLIAWQQLTTREIVRRTVSKNTPKDFLVTPVRTFVFMLFVYQQSFPVSVTVLSVRSQLTVMQRCGNDFRTAWLYARLAGHMETHAKHPEGSLRVTTVCEAVPAKWDETEKKTYVCF